MPPAGFGARLHVSEDDDLHDSEMEVSDMYAGANGLGACAQAQSLDVNPNRFHRATIVGEFDFDEMDFFFFDCGWALFGNRVAGKRPRGSQCILNTG